MYLSLLWSLGLQGGCGGREKFGGHCKEVFNRMLEISLTYYSFVKRFSLYIKVYLYKGYIERKPLT